MKYTVVRDTREQKNHGWLFDKSDTCEGTVTETLKTGDYSLKGYESIFVVERKRNTAEIATNFNEARFERELERLEAFQFPFIVFEFSLKNLYEFPVNSGIPKSKWEKLRVSPQFLVKKLNEFMRDYKTKIIFADDSACAKALVSSLFKRIIENGKNNPSK